MSDTTVDPAPTRAPAAQGTRTSGRARVKSQRLQEQEDTERALALARQRAAAAAAAEAEAAAAAEAEAEAVAEADADADGGRGVGESSKAAANSGAKTRERGKSASKKTSSKTAGGKAGAAAGGGKGKDGKGKDGRGKDRKGRDGKSKDGGKKRDRKARKATVWCICKSDGEDGRAMIECGECGDWFHFDCVNLDEDEAERLHTYICPGCETATGHTSTHTFDIATFASPSPPPGEEGTTARRKTPKPKAAKPTLSSPAPSGSSRSSSDDDASDAAIESASSDEDRPPPSEGSFKRPAQKRARASSSVQRPLATDRKPTVKRASTGLELLPARIHVQKKMSEVTKELFGERMTEEEAAHYGADIEAGIWAAFKDVVAGKDSAGGRYKTQFNLLHSSLPRARSDLRESILSRTLSPGQIATLTPSDLASAERLEEIRRAQQAVLEQTVKSKEEVSGIRFVRDGFEKVEDSREKELASLQRQEEAARRESIVAATPEKSDVPETPTREASMRSPSASVSAQMHDEHDNTAADVLSSFAPGPRRTPSIDVPPSPAIRQSFSLTSAWTGPAKIDAEELDFGTGDQSALDLSDIIVEQEPDETEMEMEMDKEVEPEPAPPPKEMDLFLAKRVVWSGGINNPADPSPVTPKMGARLASARFPEPLWNVLLPHATVDITGRVPIKSSLKFLSESRLSPAKELITVAFSLAADASEEQRARWEHLVEFHLSRDRHALYLPYGQNSASVPPGAAKELYLVPMRPSDPSPDFTDLIDGYTLPAERPESILLGVFIANREVAPAPATQSPSTAVPPPLPPPPHPQLQAQSQPVLPNEKLQALMASLNPAALQSALAGSASPAAQGGTTPLVQPPPPPPPPFPVPAYPTSGFPQPGYPPYGQSPPQSRPAPYPDAHGTADTTRSKPVGSDLMVHHGEEGMSASDRLIVEEEAVEDEGETFRSSEIVAGDPEVVGVEATAWRTMGPGRTAAKVSDSAATRSAKPPRSILGTLSRLIPSLPAKHAPAGPTDAGLADATPATVKATAEGETADPKDKEDAEVNVAEDPEADAEADVEADAEADGATMAGGKAASSEPIDVDALDEDQVKPDEATGDAAEGEEEEEEEEEAEDGEGEFEVETILDHKNVHGKFTYLVSWKGYGPEHNTWEPQEHVEHAQDVVSAYWNTRPKTNLKQTAKRGRRSATPQPSKPSKAAKASNGTRRGKASRGSTRATKVEDDDDEDDIPEFGATHVDSMDKYEDVRDWEELVQSVDTIERTTDGLIVYMTMTGGERVGQSTEVAYKRCPQKILKFYEAHLKWKVAD